MIKIFQKLLLNI